MYRNKDFYVPTNSSTNIENKRIISAVTIKFSVMTETIEESKRYLSRHRKLSHDRADRLKEENVCRDRIHKLEDIRSLLQIDFVS